MKNKWIEKKENKERNKKHTPSWAYYVTAGLMLLLGLADGPAIGYLIIGFGFPWLAKQMNN